MTSREQFEAWLRAQPHVLNVGVEQDGTYTLREDRVAWEAWQASRGAVEVDLPAACADDEYFNDGVFQPMRYERDVERAIRAAGIKVKGE